MAMITAVCQSMTSQATRAGGIRPRTKPMLGMKLVTKASSAHSHAYGTPSTASRIQSRMATMAPKVAATAK